MFRNTVKPLLLAAPLLLAVMLPASAEQKTLRIGALSTTSGPNASMGKEGLAGFNYAVRKVNEAGGVAIGGDTYKLELINIDDESKPEKTVAATERLINSEGVRFIFGPPASTTTLAILPTAEKAHAMVITYIAVAPNIIQPGFTYSFRTGQSSLQSVGPATEFAREHGAKTIAYLGRNDDWGRSAGTALHNFAAKAGLKLVMEEYFDPGTTDFYGLLTKVKSLAPDFVLSSTILEDGVPLVKQYRDLRIKAELMNLGSIWASPNFLKAVGKAAEGVYFSTGPQTSPRQQIADYRARFAQDTGAPAQTFDSSAVDGVNILLAAMQKAGSIDVDQVAAALRTLKYSGVLQDYEFRNINATTITININTIKDGKVQVISAHPSDG